MTPRLVICDLDGTLIARSSERDFVRTLLRQGSIPGSSIAGFLLGYLRHPLRTAAGDRGWNRRYLRGVQVTAATMTAERLAPVLQATLRPGVARLLDRYRALGAETFLVSASLECLVERMAALNGFDGHAGTRPETGSDGRYTGGILGVRPYGRQKVAVASGIMVSSGVSPGETVALGDSYSDRHLLMMCASGVAVHPDRRLMSLAARRGWKVLR